MCFDFHIFMETQRLIKFIFHLQDTSDIYLCETCTGLLTSAYSFWQQIKQSDEKLIIQSKQKQLTEEHQEMIEISDINYTVESIELEQSDELKYSEHMETIAIEPMRKKVRKRKSANMSTANTTIDTIAAGEQPPCLNNIAFPQFVIENVDKQPSTLDTDGRNDEFYCQDGTINNDTKMQRKQVKTLRPSAFVPPDLNKINELLSISPLESDTDTTSTIFKCSHCPKAYAAPHHLMVHMRKSHLCQYCLATFSKITDLYGHVKEMHRTFECLLCSKEFQSNGNLRQHMRKNHSIFLPAHISLLNVSNANESDVS